MILYTYFDSNSVPHFITFGTLLVYAIPLAIIALWFGFWFRYPRPEEDQRPSPQGSSGSD